MEEEDDDSVDLPSTVDVKAIRSDIDSDSSSSGSGGQDSDSESCGWSDVADSLADEQPGHHVVPTRHAAPPAAAASPHKARAPEPQHVAQSRHVANAAAAPSPHKGRPRSRRRSRLVPDRLTPVTTASVPAGTPSSPRPPPVLAVPAPQPLSGSDDSEFEVAVLGGVRAALKSLEDDAEVAERVTTPEKQTWWKNKLKQSAQSRGESGQSLVRPWESRTAGTPLGAAGARRPPPDAPPPPRTSPSTGRNGLRLSVRVDEKAASPPRPSSGGRSPYVKIGNRLSPRSPRCALPSPGESHTRKPSLSEILNLENKNSHLRAARQPLETDYDGAPKLPHELRGG
ncbi:myosin-1-like [Pollicipes pollicipes]|uniref:myosin-1-like n=1 Tax=Pollicipes pollicipes TaxID=41117 RepID=UPI00188582BE|nr:myosin-1-like [Pollicipes pollicipes]